MTLEVKRLYPLLDQKVNALDLLLATQDLTNISKYIILKKKINISITLIVMTHQIKCTIINNNTYRVKIFFFNKKKEEK